VTEADALALLAKDPDDLLVEFGAQLAGLTADQVRASSGNDSQLARLRHRAQDWFQIHAAMLHRAAQDSSVVTALHSGQGTALLALAAFMMGNLLSEQAACTAAALVIKLGVEALCDDDPFAGVTGRKRI